MKSGFALLAVSVAMAVFTLALFIPVVGGSTSGAADVAIGLEEEAAMKSDTGNRLPSDQKPDTSHEETLSLTEPISIYFPLLDKEYVKYPAERAALITLYQQTNGDDWINNTGWGTNYSHCDWYGVTCDEDGHVIILSLNENKLTGTLPSEIGNLANLQILYLWANQLTSIPPEIGNLEKLVMLYLGSNQLTSLPPETGNLANLQRLDLSYNQLKSLPPETGKLENLLGLYVNGNHLMSLPTEIGNLSNLEFLLLGGNQLTSISPEIGNLMNLKVLYLSDNQLSGIIPAFLSHLHNLGALTLYNNPNLTCWETQAARDWVFSLDVYMGPTCFFP